MRDTLYEEMEPPVYLDEFWDAEREAGFWDAESAESQFAEDGTWDVAPASPVLAMSVIRTAEGDVSGLSNDELLGAISATERVQGQAAWAANVLAAEYARRNLEIDDKTGEETLGEFGADDYAQEIRVSGMTAKRNLTRSLTLSQLPRCMELAHDGALSDYRQRIVAEETAHLDPALQGKADELIARDAVGRTPLSLRRRVRAIVMKLDPLAAETRRKNGTKSRRVEFWESESGNVTMAAREMGVAVAAAIKQALDGWAKIMRATGIEGSLDNLRSDAAAALLLGRHPVTGTAAPAGTGNPADPANPFNPWEYPDYEPGMGSDEPPVPGSPVVNINLMITTGTLDRRVDAPGFVSGFGNITAQAARDLIIAGSANRASRWCVTEVDPVTGYAVSHGCARGPHPWPGPGAGPPSGEPPGNGPPGQQIREFIASLKVRMESLATQPGEQGRTEPGHDPSRKLRHMIEARRATCATPGCDTPAVDCDMEHRIEYENEGPTSEGNLDPATHGHCHRVKQHPEWKVIKTGPQETIWIGPSGRKRIVRPTRHLL